MLSYLSHALIKADIPEPIRKRFMGHSLGSGDAYVTKDIEELRGYYSKAWPFISLDVDPGQIEDLTLKVRRLEQ